MPIDYSMAVSGVGSAGGGFYFVSASIARASSSGMLMPSRSLYA